jgi:hypothetical protein
MHMHAYFMQFCSTLVEADCLVHVSKAELRSVNTIDLVQVRLSRG